jgi:hypothetical protein
VVIFCHVLGPAVLAERDMPGIFGADDGQSFGHFQPLVGASLTLAEVRERPFFANGLRFGMLQPPSSATAKAGTMSNISHENAATTYEVFTMANSLLHRMAGNRGSNPTRSRASAAEWPIFRVATCPKSGDLRQERLRGENSLLLMHLFAISPAPFRVLSTLAPSVLAQDVVLAPSDTHKM